MTIHSNFFFNEEEFILLLYSKFLSTYIVLVLKIPENRILVPNLVWGGIFDFNCLLVSFYIYVLGKILLI